MAYNEKHLAKLADLKALGTKQKEVADALAARVDTLENVGSQANVLEGVKVNGTALAIANKMVDILIATGSKNGSISVNGADVAIKGLAALAFKAKVSQSDLDDALAAVLEGKADKAMAEAIIHMMILDNDRKFSEILSRLTLPQKELLYAIAKDGIAKQITSTVFVKRHNLRSASSVQSAIKKLLEYHLVSTSLGTYYIDDQLMKLWLN